MGAGRGGGMGRGGDGETKDGKEKIKQKMITNKTEPNQRESRTQKKWVSTKGEMDGWGWGREGWPRTLRSAPGAAPAGHVGGPAE